MSRHVTARTPMRRGFAGLVGGLEILGELVLSTEQEKQRLDLGRFTYDSVSAILAAVGPLGVSQPADF